MPDIKTSDQKLSAHQFLGAYSAGKYKADGEYITRDDLVKLVKSPITQALLTEDAFKVLGQVSEEDTFRSISDFDGRIASYDFLRPNGEDDINEEYIKEKLKTTAERAVEKLLGNFRNIRDGKDSSGAPPTEFSSYNPTITEDEIDLLRDYVSGKATLDDVIKKCNSKGFSNAEELANSIFNSGASTVFKNIALLKPEVKEKMVDILGSIGTFLGNFDSDRDGMTQIEEILKARSNDNQAGISSQDIAIQIKKQK